MTECREECEAGGVHSLGPRNKNGELATGEKRQVICASVTKVLRTECARAHTQRLDSHVPQAASLKVQLRKDVPGTALALMRATCKEKGERGLLAGEEGLRACAKVRLLDEHECARRFRGRREFIPPRTSGVVGCDCTEEHRLGCWPSTRRPRGRPQARRLRAGGHVAPRLQETKPRATKDAGDNQSHRRQGKPLMQSTQSMTISQSVC